jgi:hypothetical protein
MCKFDVYAPLIYFDWQGSSFSLAPGLWLTRFDKKPDLRGLGSKLSEDEQDEVSSASHWLNFTWDEGTEPSPAETMNMALLSLWLVKRTRTHVTFRFELASDPSSGKKRICRVFERFAWVEHTIHDSLDDADLAVATSFYGVVQKLCYARCRLNDALFLTLAGCWAHNWQPALICHAAAAEAILTYSKASGITRRLATAYACLVEAQAPERDRAFREFSDLYSVRSDIMHGRSQNVLQVDRLPMLVRFNDMLRRLWSAVLLSPRLVSVLDGTDAQREGHFLGLQAGYKPPP